MQAANYFAATAAAAAAYKRPTTACALSTRRNVSGEAANLKGTKNGSRRSSCRTKKQNQIQLRSLRLAKATFRSARPTTICSAASLAAAAAFEPSSPALKSSSGSLLIELPLACIIISIRWILWTNMEISMEQVKGETFCNLRLDCQPLGKIAIIIKHFCPLHLARIRSTWTRFAGADTPSAVSLANEAL